MGALGAILGDSALFWIARKNAKRLERQVTRAKANKQVQQAFDLMDRVRPCSSSVVATCQACASW